MFSDKSATVTSASSIASGERPLLMHPSDGRAGLPEPIVERPSGPASGNALRSLQTPSHNLQRRTADPDQQLDSCSADPAKLRRHVTSQVLGEAHPREPPPTEHLRRLSSGDPRMLDAHTPPAAAGAAATAFRGLTGAAWQGSPVMQLESLSHQASRAECADAMDVLRHIVSLTQRQGSSNNNGSSAAMAPARTGDTSNHTARRSPEAAAEANGQWAVSDHAASGHDCRTALLDGNLHCKRGLATSALAEGPVPTREMEQAARSSYLPRGPAHAGGPGSAPADPAPQRRSSVAVTLEQLPQSHSCASVALPTSAAAPWGSRPTARDVPMDRQPPSPPPTYDSRSPAHRQPTQVVGRAAWNQQPLVSAPALPQLHTFFPPQPPSHLSTSPPATATSTAAALDASRWPPPHLPPRLHPSASLPSSARRSPLDTERPSPLISSTPLTRHAAAANAAAGAAGVPTGAPPPGVQPPSPIAVTVIPSKCSDDKDAGRASDGSGGGGGQREVQGKFCPKRYLDNVECVLCDGEWLSRSAFERVGVPS